jgi:hypothetical protein
LWSQSRQFQGFSLMSHLLCRILNRVKNVTFPFQHTKPEPHESHKCDYCHRYKLYDTCSKPNPSSVQPTRNFMSRGYIYKLQRTERHGRVVSILTSSPGIPGLNLGPEIGYPVSGFSRLSSVLSGKLWNSTSNQATTVSFHTVSNSLYVCMYVSVCVCLCVCMYVRMYVCVYVFMSACSSRIENPICPILGMLIYWNKEEISETSKLRKLPWVRVPVRAVSVARRLIMIEEQRQDYSCLFRRAGYRNKGHNP